METNNRHHNSPWQSEGYSARGNNHLRRVDEDMYRGAYRFDNESDHHNETTYDGFDLNDSWSGERHRGNNRGENNQGGDYVYRRSLNNQDNDRRYQEDYRRNNNASYRNASYRNGSDSYGGYYDDRFGDGSSNFNNSYSPDPYRNQNRDQNYGNMAGSLSFGYDGDYNSDPDYRRRYDPMSGRIRNNREEERRRRHPNSYGPPDKFGINPDYDRY